MTHTRIFVLVFGLTLASFGACTPRPGNDCEASYTCSSTGDGDLGGASSGGTGDGDGDGDTGGTGGNAPVTCETLSCDDETPHCDEDADAPECMQCLENEHCAGETPLCGDAGVCEGCSDAASCGDLGNYCLPSGACVECLPVEDDRESDEDACGTGVCDPDTFTCNDALTQSAKDICDSCISDSECLVGQNCIPLQYSGGAEPAELGNFCMKVFPGCSPPYSAGAINRASVSGAPATDYCGLAEGFTTCAAIKDLKDGKLCSADSQCGTEHGEGRCESVNGDIENKCTYSCTLSSQCVAGAACGGLVGDQSCGGTL